MFSRKRVIAEPKSRRFVALVIRGRLSFNGGRVARAGEVPEKRGEKKRKKTLALRCSSSTELVEGSGCVLYTEKREK